VGYIILLALSLIVLIVAPIWIGTPGSARSRLFAALTPPFLLFILTLHASTFFLPAGSWIVYWAIVTGRYAFALNATRAGRSTIAKCESLVLTCSEPLVVPGLCALLSYGGKYPGLPVMTAGIILVSVGAYAWANVRSPEAGRPVPDGSPTGAVETEMVN
jgi:hypothetical protein